MAKVVLTEKENKLLKQMYWWSGFVFIGFTMTKMEANGFTLTMAPMIEELYKDNEEERKAAYRRHQQFFNTHAVMFAFIAGLAAAMEKEKATNGSVTGDAINNIKVALMGPTAGIGDAFFFNCVRVIAAGIGIGMCQQGNFLGTLIFIVLYGGSQLIIRWVFIKTGYTMGTSFIDMAFGSGLIDSVTKAASVLGMTMVGAMVAQQVNVKLNWIINLGGAEVNVLTGIFDVIMPGILSIGLVFLLMSLIKKGVSPTKLVLGILCCCIVGGLLHIF